jgi:hypothetical protein
MDFEKLWNQILCAATEKAFDVSTVPQNNRTPLWFNVHTIEAHLYVDNTSNKKPSVRLSGARRITKDDFLNVAGYYERWKNGETHLRQEVREQSRNTAYIFGLISQFSKA